MKMPTMVIIGVLVFIIGFLVMYSRQHGAAPPFTPYSQGMGQPPVAGGYGAAAGGYGAPGAGGYGAPAAGAEQKSQ